MELLASAYILMIYVWTLYVIFDDGPRFYHED
mgnify:CR=1 FL=1